MPLPSLPIGDIRLSKSRYTIGLQCLRWLWLTVHRPDAPELVRDEAVQAIMDQGTRVGEVARSYVPGGVLIDLPHDALAERVAATRRAIDRGAHILYEASFFADDVFVAVDILARKASGWTIIEVKSTTRVKPEHLPDVAVQKHVLEKSGLEVTGAEVMHLDRACTHPDLSNLFARIDVTETIAAASAAVPEEIARQLEVLRGPMPDAEMGVHCREPNRCPLVAGCWKSVPPHHVSTLYHAGRKAFAMMEEGYDLIEDVPPTLMPREASARQQRAIQAGTLIVEGDLAAALLPFERPLAFLDFETVGPAIPVWPGCHPFDAVPVQFSCHIERSDGSLDHHEWIAEATRTDPRPALARRVIEACRGAAAVVGYTPFESQCLRHLAAAVPDLAAELESIDRRMLDLHPCIRDHVYHPDFAGRFSLKSVLPALVQGLGYENLDVADGHVASTRLRKLLIDGEPADPDARERVRGDLLAYCRMDTLGMVKLLERLRGLARP